MIWPFHLHRWIVVSVYHVNKFVSSQSQHLNVTNVAMRCFGCGKLKTKTLEGLFTLEQLRGEADEVSKVLAGVEKASK